MQQLLRFTLDLFDSLAPSVPPLAPSLRKLRAQTPKKPLPQVYPAQAATDLIAFDVLQPAATPALQGPQQPAVALAPLLAQASFSHPRANRHVLLGPCTVAYELKRGKRRTIGFVVGPDGLAVSAPKWVALQEIDAAVREKSPWILKKLDESHQRQQRLASARIVWQDGAILPFLGDSVVVRLDPQRSASAVLVPAAEGGTHSLLVGLPHHASPAQIRDAVQAWLMRQAKRIFVERLDHFAPQLNVKWRKLSLSNAGTRWGSASADGSIRLNWRLVHYRMPVIDYVVAHELAHLRVMDHSPRFWDTVATVVPDYAQLRGQLKDDSMPRW
jgi:predicted metal-dependent hydrolase